LSWKKFALLTAAGIIFGGLVLAYYLFEHADLDI
jgi:hypothetical protein